MDEIKFRGENYFEIKQVTPDGVGPTELSERTTVGIDTLFDFSGSVVGDMKGGGTA